MVHDCSAEDWLSQSIANLDVDPDRVGHRCLECQSVTCRGSVDTVEVRSSISPSVVGPAITSHLPLRASWVRKGSIRTRTPDPMALEQRRRRFDHTANLVASVPNVQTQG